MFIIYYALPVFLVITSTIEVLETTRRVVIPRERCISVHTEAIPRVHTQLLVCNVFIRQTAFLV